MKTKFWDNTDMNIDTMLDPAWSAQQAIKAYEDNFKYKFIHILREPPRVKEIEKR